MDEDFGGGEDLADDAAEFEAETTDIEHDTAPAEALAPEAPQRPQEPPERHEPQEYQQQPQQPQHPLQSVYSQWAPQIEEWSRGGHFAAAMANPAQAVHSLFTFVSRLESDPEGTIAQLQQAYGVQSDRQTAYQAQSHKLQTMLDDFTKDKPHYSELRPQVVQEIVNIRRTSPTLPPDQTLRLAYHNVMDRTGYGNIIEQRREAERRAEQLQQQKAKAAKARRSTAVNVRSGVSAPTSHKSMVDTINAIATKHYGN